MASIPCHAINILYPLLQQSISCCGNSPSNPLGHNTTKPCKQDRNTAMETPNTNWVLSNCAANPVIAAYSAACHFIFFVDDKRSRAKTKGRNDVNQTSTVQSNQSESALFINSPRHPPSPRQRNCRIQGAKSTSKNAGHNSGRLDSITASQTDLTNVSSTGPKPKLRTKIRTHIRVNIIPPTQSSVGEINDSPLLEYIAFGIPRPTIQLIVNSRFPVNGTPKGIGRCCLASSCVLLSLGGMSDGKVANG